MAGGALLSGASARHLSAAIGPARVVVLGLALEVPGAGGSALVAGSQGGPWLVAATLVPYGVGLGLASAQLTSTVLRDVPVAQSGMGSAIQSTVRQLGSALGSAVGGTALAIAIGDVDLRRVAPADFATGASSALWVAAGVLGLGLVSSMVVAKVAGRQ